ncbi:MAG: hypothetical protein M3437_10390 [Chloroflexota bacterium]|nr:hypothetical protein [Chloroflexota bacterium]MDQ5866168.1 hypothetical protein [Chloroflexota bacterium]
MPRNPMWSREELILALDLYIREGMPDKSHPEIIKLSQLLNQLSANMPHPDGTRFRNPNGVAMKLANFAALDPAYHGRGLTSGGKGDQKVWDEFRLDRQRLKDEAARIRQEAAIGLREMQLETPIAPDVEEPGPTERKDTQVSRIIRDSAVTKYVKQLYKNKCQVCGRVIMLPRQEYSEAHHLQPLGKGHNGPDTVGNVVVVCPEHHVEFDFGAIAVQPSDLSVIHIDPSNPGHGKKLTLHADHNLNRSYLKYHLEHIFNK